MKIQIKNLFMVALFGLFAFTACDNNSSAEEAREDAQEAVDEMGDELEEERNELRRDIQGAQQDIDRRIAKMEAEMKDASAEAKAETQQAIDKLKMKKNQLGQDLENFGNKAENEWAQFKANVRKTIDEIGDDID